jgi:hypothetical protein
MTKRTYAVSWKEDDGPVFAGKLGLGPTHVRLEGRSAAGDEVVRVFHYGDIGRVSTERRNGHRGIAVSWYGRRLSITVVDGAGAFAELLDELRHRAVAPQLQT